MPELVVERLNAALEGRYRIERELGAGGMATVFLAQDLRHRRQVAVKVLRPELAAVVGAERFLAEIETTANLQHPHILPLFDSGEADSFLFYVMPYVEGESLRERLQREQQLPVEEALGMAEKVAAALEYAHEQGVVHRDIKPANILLSRGEPLVADFGIALAVSQAGGGRITETGLSLGTPHYMSPEQAAGERSLDPRSDVYALGCVLYEMLTGQPPFGGPNAQAVLGRILTGDPEPLTIHRRSVPRHVEAAVLKSLERLPADRFDSAADFSRALRNPSFTTEVGTARRGGSFESAGRWKVATGAACLTAIVAGGLAVWGWLPEKPAAVVRYSMELPAGQELQMSVFGRRVDISPDGSHLVYVGPGETRHRLWLRSRSQLHATPITGTEGATYPTFSPDGRRIAFMTADFNLGVVSVEGEPPVTFPVADNAAVGLSWGPDGFLYYGAPGGIFRIPANGGSPEQVTRVNQEAGESYHILPHALPGGLIYSVQGGTTSPGELSLVMVDVESKEVRSLLQGMLGRYARSGHLVHVGADGTLLAAPFDLTSLEVTGPAVPLARGVFIGLGAVDLSLSGTGTLVYRAGSQEAGGSMVPVRVSRDGREEIIDPGWRGDFSSLGLSPDGRRLAVGLYGAEGQHIWIKELDQGPLSKLTFQGSENSRPTWTSDGRQVAFYSNRGGAGFAIWQKRADGSGEPRVLEDQRDPVEVIFSPDGAWALYRSSVTESGGADILGRRLGPSGEGDEEAVPLVASQYREVSPALSPDGRWLAYMSDESGREEVFVRPFPEVDRGRWQVSIDGGNEPLWSRSGREIFYRRANGDLMAVQVRADSSFAAGSHEVLFSASSYASDYNHRFYDVLPGDSAFVMLRLGEGGGDSHLVVVENFFTELREKVGR